MFEDDFPFCKVGYVSFFLGEYGRHMDPDPWDKDSTTSTNFAPQQRHTSSDFGKTEGALAGRRVDRG